MHGRRDPENWWPFGCAGVGFALIAVLVIGNALQNSGNPYSASGLVIFGVLAVTVGTGIAIFDVTRRFVPGALAVVASVVGSVPIVLPLFQADADFGTSLLYVLMLAAVNWATRPRSVAALSFFVLLVTVTLAVILLVVDL
jgi:hypothetical protein